ncbi:ylmG homolog protein 2, chloroplastic [Rhododendron vialii]|uniref:ylmG homolog protein 2, chloroplastic n=1 Tax=Rhododendron vialii TaxID=182163 RepID=UPI00265DFD50|nr:ylmG homolog protein 2, chloroplastic [Rhododendron vialii]
MAFPSPPPSSLLHQSDDSSPGTQKTLVANKLLSNALLLSSSSCSSSSSFRHFTPLLLLNQQPSYPKFNVHVPAQVAVAERLFRDFHKSVVSAADGCLGFVQSFASKSPLFDKLLSLPSHFRNFSQIHQKNYRNLNCLSKHNFGAVLPGDSVAGLVVANGIINFLNIYNTLLVVRLVLTWFPNSPPAIVSPLSTLCDPYLNIFRGIIPPLGGTLDLSPILAFLVLNAFTSTASALPAELPSTGVSQEFPPSNPNTSHQKWMRRLNGSRRKGSDSGH